MAHRVSGAPLVMRTLMAHLYLVRHCYIAVAHHIHGAPLMSILAIAVFLVVGCQSLTGKKIDKIVVDWINRSRGNAR